MKKDYISLVLLIERLHRRFLDVVKSELDSFGIEDINNVQTLILYNIGDSSMTVGELTNRGYYLGSNVSYNIKKLVANEFLIQERSSHDKRSVKVRLSEKGLSLCGKIDALFQNNIASLETKGFGKEEINLLINRLRGLEDFWSGCVDKQHRS